jgi:hypothetical protein
VSWFANSGLKIANRELAQIGKFRKNPKRFRCLAGEGINRQPTKAATVSYQSISKI